VRPERLFLVDVWRHSSAGGEYEWAMYARTSQTELDDIYAGVLRRFKGQIEQGRVVVKREPSLDAAKQWPDASMDWAYIDADHTYDAVLADLEAYWRILKPGGLLAGDDYGLMGWWGDGVTRAVAEFARVHQVQVTVMGSQFVIEKPSTPATR
jgi:predicted O-methyltransferase YrrM